MRSCGATSTFTADRSCEVHDTLRLIESGSVFLLAIRQASYSTGYRGGNLNAVAAALNCSGYGLVNVLFFPGMLGSNSFTLVELISWARRDSNLELMLRQWRFLQPHPMRPKGRHLWFK